MTAPSTNTPAEALTEEQRKTLENTARDSTSMFIVVARRGEAVRTALQVIDARDAHIAELEAACKEVLQKTEEELYALQLAQSIIEAHNENVAHTEHLRELLRAASLALPAPWSLPRDTSLAIQEVLRG